MRKPVLLLSIVPAALRIIGAQQLARTAYYDYLPPTPRIVAQTAASARLHLFGDVHDTAYRDIDPLDGVDDRRADRLRVIAERFSPLLGANHLVVPRVLVANLGPVHELPLPPWSGAVMRRSS